MRSLKEWSEYVADWREGKGFETNWGNVMEKLMLVVTEVSEAAEAYRKDDLHGFSEEVADSFIRLFDLCGSLDIDIEKCIEEKMVVNEKRPYKHGKRC